MIKIHNKTKLKYLCQTKRKNYMEYTGSGVYWLKHLKKHGFDFTTILLYQNDDLEIFTERCLYYSHLFEVDISGEYANLIHELGPDQKQQFIYWWKYASHEMKKEVYKKRGKSLKLYWANLSDLKYTHICENMSVKQTEFWCDIPFDERKIRMEKCLIGLNKFHEDKDGDSYIEWKESLSKSSLNRYNEMTIKDKKKLGVEISKTRLSMSMESKLNRKRKIQKVYDTGKHDELFLRYSKERKGVNNPNATIIVWENIEYTRSQFVKYIRNITLSRKECFYILDNNPTDTCFYKRKFKRKHIMLVCPHCDKKSSKNQSAMLRWHFDNCKHKKDIK